MACGVLVVSMVGLGVMYALGVCRVLCVVLCYGEGGWRESLA